MANTKALKERYGESAQGGFAVIDKIGVPHPYCVGSKLVAFAADRHGGILNEHAIEQAEKNGIFCETCKGKLSFKEHEQALLVACYVEAQDEDGKAVPELQEYLERCKPLCEEDKLAGFAFCKARKVERVDQPKEEQGNAQER